MVDARRWIVVALDKDATFPIERVSCTELEFTECSVEDVGSLLSENEPAGVVYCAAKTSHAVELRIKEWKRTRPVTQFVAYFDSAPGVTELVALMRGGCFDVWTTNLQRDVASLFRELEDRIRFVQVGRLERLQLKQEHRQLGLVGDSAETYNLLKLLNLAASSSLPVLIGGETGTGKTMIARAIHALSERNGKPFVTVDCGCLAPDLAESELFGSKKGAFTGAGADRTGLITAADGGTAFLDEVGELPISMQPKLLRVLEEGEVRQVGSATTRKVNVRVISATNRDIDDMLERGDFRSDLYYRINHHRIDLAPLRDRREDIEPLAVAFAARHSIGGMPVQVDNNVIRIFKGYNWPGNVRELKSVVDAAAVELRTNCLTLQYLPGYLLQAAGVVALDKQRGVTEKDVIPLRDLESFAIEKAMLATNRDVARAAQLLGIGRTTVYRRLRENLENCQFN